VAIHQKVDKLRLAKCLFRISSGGKGK